MPDKPRREVFAPWQFVVVFVVCLALLYSDFYQLCTEGLVSLGMVVDVVLFVLLIFAAILYYCRPV